VKRLIICCDGTWNRADHLVDGAPCPTNVVRLAYRIAKRDRHTRPRGLPPVRGEVSNHERVRRAPHVAHALAIDERRASFEPGLWQYQPKPTQHVTQMWFPGVHSGIGGGYRDRARSIAGMIRKTGILERRHVLKYADALALCRSDDAPDTERPMAFREQHAIGGVERIEIRFIGVWARRRARHAPIRALRARSPALSPVRDQLNPVRGEVSNHERARPTSRAAHASATIERRAPFEPGLWQYQPKPTQHVTQMRFPGVHSDIGGGYRDRGLSDIALHWMIDEARSAGLVFDGPAADAHPLAPNPLAPLHQSKTGLYRVTVGIDREIGRSTRHVRGEEERENGNDPTQQVHESARLRWDQDPRYRPRGLREYFRRVGDGRADT
jgi:hypothetical protein